MVSGIQVAVDDIDDDCLLERALVTLLIEAHIQRLHRGGALPGREGRGLILGTDEIRGTRIRGLEWRPIRVEFERELEPRTVGQTGSADLIVDQQLCRGTGLEAFHFAAHLPREGQHFAVHVGS